MLARKSGPWKIEFPDGETYEGDVVRGKAHGNGKYAYADGSIYEGQWKDDRYHGHGKMIANGCIYGGQWVNGKEHGKGVSIYHTAEHAAKKGQQDVVDHDIHHDDTGEDIDINSEASAADVYNGEFKNGMRDGVGTYKYSNGRTYEGQWKEGIYHGQGTETYADGRIYTGAWHNDTKHGIMGTMSYTNGDTYKGSWSHDAMLEGTYTFFANNGTCPIMKMYQGQFEGGYFNGMGTCWYTNGNIYKGKWKDDCQHGEGKMVYDTTTNDNDNDHTNGHDNVVYEGDWIVGKRHGHGKLTKNSTVYEGDWSNDKKQGMGTLTDESNGDVVEQVYYNDELVAIAKNNHGSSSLSKGKGGGGFRYCYDDFKISCIDDSTSNHDVQDDNSLMNNGRSNGNNEVQDEEGSVDGRINLSAIATRGCEHDYGYSCHECIRKQQPQTQANDNIGGKQLLLPKRIAFLIELLEHKFPVNEEEEYSTFQWLLQGKYPANVNATTTRSLEGGGSASSTPTSTTSEHEHVDSSTMMVDHQYKLKKKKNKKISSSSSSSSISSSSIRKKKVQQQVDGILIEGCTIPEINGKYNLIVDECFSVSTTASTYDTTAASSSSQLYCRKYNMSN